MSQQNILSDYILSQHTVERLKVIKEKLKEDINQVDPLWKIVAGKNKEEEEEEYISEEESTDDKSNDEDDCTRTMPNVNQLQFTQFYATQVEKSFDREIKQTSVQKSDIVECLFEQLEHANGKLDLSEVENLSDDDLVEVVSDLGTKLSVTGIYNLCCSMNSMSLEERMKYTATFHSRLLLPRIIALEEPSRLLLSVIIECVQKFPDDIEKLIFIPLLNVDLKDTTIVNAIAGAFEPQRNIVLIREYLSSVNELKFWHLPILQNLLSVKTDQGTNDKLIQLFAEKALDFAKDKLYGKLVLSFIKVNGIFSEQQKKLLLEIANINQSLFKRPIQNILNTL